MKKHKKIDSRIWWGWCVGPNQDTQLKENLPSVHHDNKYQKKLTNDEYVVE